jgi:hypothetical protein
MRTVFAAARPSQMFGLPAILAIVLCVTVKPALADRYVPLGDGWQTYINERYDMRFDYPADVFTPEAAPANGDGQSFAGKEVSLQIFAFHNHDQKTPATLKKQLAGKEGYEKITYSPSGDTWLVMSGFRGSRIFYEKYFFKAGVISAFGIEFPAGEKPRYAPIIERIEDSFRAGGAD